MLLFAALWIVPQHLFRRLPLEPHARAGEEWWWCLLRHHKAGEEWWWCRKRWLRELCFLLRWTLIGRHLITLNASHIITSMANTSSSSGTTSPPSATTSPPSMATSSLSMLAAAAIAASSSMVARARRCWSSMQEQIGNSVEQHRLRTHGLTRRVRCQ